MFKKVLFYLVVLVSLVVIIATLLSLLHHISQWYIKVLDFPRTQFLMAAVACLIMFLMLNKGWQTSKILLIAGLLASITFQSLHILPYTFLGDKVVPTAEVVEPGKRNTVSILIANVYMHNRNADKLLRIIEETDPDMVLAMETNQWWVNQLATLKEEYPNTMLHPLDNTYGMALYSRYPLLDSDIKFISEPDVPSFHTQVQLPNKDVFMFHGVHPVPPVPSSKYPDNVGEKEIALQRVGEMVVSNDLPDIVAGDYNDVAWSQNTQLFKSRADLENVRKGRGLYNTFNAKSIIMRWPLDHYFVTEHFSLLQLELLPEFNSDHFPMYASFVLENPQ